MPNLLADPCHSPTDLHYLWLLIYANSLSTSGRRCWSGRAGGFPGNAVHKTELRSQTLLYQTLYARWNENDIQNFLKTVGFYQKYSDIKTTKRAELNQGFSPPPNIQIYLCDITNTGKQHCSPNEPFVVVLEKGFFFFYERAPFGVDFEICNSVDRSMLKHTHTHWLKFKKWKSIIGPLS